MNDTKLLVKAYLDRKDGKLPSAYNFDLAEMMKNFNFYDFCAEAKGSRNYSVEHGALLVITDRQYILSYNSSFGIGSHAATSVRVYADIHGIGKVHNNRTASEMYSKCVFQYITARIAYDRDSGFIHFVPYKGNITEDMFRVFEKFYNAYNSDIEYVCNRFRFVVSFSYHNEDGKLIRDESSNLDNYYNYLYSKVDTNKDIYDDEIIIGKTVDKNNIRKL